MTQGFHTPIHAAAIRATEGYRERRERRFDLSWFAYSPNDPGKECAEMGVRGNGREERGERIQGGRGTDRETSGESVLKRAEMVRKIPLRRDQRRSKANNAVVLQRSSRRVADWMIRDKSNGSQSRMRAGFQCWTLNATDDGT
jgi:hypothetical protein